MISYNLKYWGDEFAKLAYRYPKGKRLPPEIRRGDDWRFPAVLLQYREGENFPCGFDREKDRCSAGLRLDAVL